MATHKKGELLLTEIPDHPLTEILLRLPTPEDLARACAACSTFHRIATDGSFRRRFRRLHAPPLLGFLNREGFHPAVPPHPAVPAARALARIADFSFSFLPSYCSWTVRDVRDGRVLLARGPDPHEDEQPPVFADLVYLVVPVECAVCLLEFGDDDSLRLLPACPHAFHSECIGLWLAKHVTCPLCRASVLDPPVLDPEELMQPPSPEEETPAPHDSPRRLADHDTVVVLIEDPGCDDEEDERTRILARRMRCEAAGRQALPWSNSTGHERAGGTEQFALRLPEHVRLEILMSHRLRHVTSAVAASVRVREGSAHNPSAGGNSVRSAVARLLSLFTPGDGRRGDDEEKSGGSSR